MKNIFLLVFMTLIVVMLAGCAPNSVVEVNTPVPSAKSGAPGPDTGKITLPGASIQVYAPGPNPLVNTPDSHGSPAGIVLGIWHGFISPVTIIMGFINKTTQMYEVHNDGSLYNLGFFLGVLILFLVIAIIGGGR